jgi:hypothetical protein
MAGGNKKGKKSKKGKKIALFAFFALRDVFQRPITRGNQLTAVDLFIAGNGPG